jgi:hypothetical protein
VEIAVSLKADRLGFLLGLRGLSVFGVDPGAYGSGSLLERSNRYEKGREPGKE